MRMMTASNVRESDDSYSAVSCVRHSIPAHYKEPDSVSPTQHSIRGDDEKQVPVVDNGPTDTPGTAGTVPEMTPAQLRQKSKSSAMAMYVGLLMAVGGFLYGYDTGIINGLLEMQYVKDTFPTSHRGFFTANQTAFITATLSIGTFVGSLFAPLVSDRFGRRMSIFASTTCLFTLGTVLQTASNRIALLCVGRFISGFGVGMISAIIPLYQAESSPKWIRGSVISLYQWAITWGLLVSSAITQATHTIDDSRCYRVPIGIQLVWGTTLSIGMYLLPESPRFYVKKDRLDDAIYSLSRFRRLPIDDKSLIEELIEIKASHDYEMSFGETSILDCFRSSPSRASQLRRMLTGMILQALQQCSGINFIFYYGVNFFVRTGVQNSYLISFVTYAVNVAFTIPGILFVEVLGRRPLMIIGAGGMTVSNFVIGAVGVTTDSVIANKIMVAFVCVFIAFFASTWGPVTWVLVGEMYSLSVRQKAVSITTATNWIVNFVFALCTPYLIDTGTHTAALGTKIFFLWGTLNFVGLIFSYLYVYETKGLMLEEVDELFRVCKSARRSRQYKPRAMADSSGIAPPTEPADSSGGPMDKSDVVASTVAQATTVGSTHNTQSTRSTQGVQGVSTAVMSSILNIPNNVPPSINSMSDEDLDEIILGWSGSSGNRGSGSSDNRGSGSSGPSGPTGSTYNYSNQEDLMNFIYGLGVTSEANGERSES